MTSAVRLIDCETFPIARARLAQRPVCVQDSLLSNPCGTARITRWSDALPLVARWLTTRGETLVGLNVAYEFACFAVRHPSLLPFIYAKYEAGEVQDIGINQKILDVAYGVPQPEDAYGLEALCDRFKIAHVKDSPWRMRFGELEGLHPDVYPEEARRYALEDVLHPAKIWQEQQAQHKKWVARMGSACLHIAPEKARTAWFLHLDQCWGVHTHPERVEAFTLKTEKRLAAYRRRLQRATIEVNHPNPKKWGRKEKGVRIGADGTYRTPFVRADGTACKRAATTYIQDLSARRGFDLKLSEKTGEPSTDKTESEKSGSHVLEAFCAYGSAKGLRARCDDLAAGYEYPLQARWNPMLKTGRTSCSKPGEKSPLRGTQLQNPPREVGVRECFEPPAPGWVFFDADFPSAELHSLAQVQICWFGRSRLADLLNDGKDVLLWFGATVLNGMPYEEAVRLKAAKDPRIKEWRQMAKAYIYGLPGGLGAKKMVGYAWSNYRVILTERQAARDKQTWMDALDMGPYFERIDRGLKGRETGWLQHPISGLWRGGAFYTALCNSGFQSLTAFGACDAAFHVSKEQYAVPNSPLYGTRQWAFVHDQIISSAREEHASAAAIRKAELMAERYNRWVPDVPIKTGKTEPCVMRVWSKHADPVWSADKRSLIPWEPKT